MSISKVNFTIEYMDKFYIGLDLGGTKTAISLGKVNGDKISILLREEIPTKKPIETLDPLINKINGWAKEYKIRKIGISAGGPLDGKKGIILTPPNLPDWHNFAIVDYVKNKTGIDARLQNDANACALAEYKFGAGIGSTNMVFLTFGTGLGAGLILNGKLYAGSNDNAGEVGHFRLSNVGPYAYGKTGSFEAFSSGSGIKKLAIYLANKEKKMPNCIKEMGGFDKVSTRLLAKYAFEGDKFAKKVFRQSGKMFGKGLSLIIDIINPDLIVAGGVYMRAHQLFEKEMMKEINKEALKENREIVKIVPAKLSENVGDYAAISIAVEE